jgi:NAD(P)-dependent dehydrogenase (short-subunit alcohol dehydrogenase family)
MDLTGKRIVVTGASSGIGRECAVFLSRLGARLILVARSEERLSCTLGDLEGEGHRMISFDLNQIDEIPALIKQIADDGGALYAAIHCAGIQQTLPVRSVTSHHIAEVFDVNVSAGLALAKGLRQKGLHEPDCRLVLMASVMGIVGSVGRSVYSASKGAVISMTRSLALELAKDGIRVNCIVPGMVRSEMLEDLERTIGSDKFEAIKAMQPLGFGKAVDVAFAVGCMLAPMASWITGTAFVVDGGYTAH